MKLDPIGRRALAAAVLATSLASMRAAHADDFTFNVPVELHALPSSLTNSTGPGGQSAGNGSVRCSALSVVPAPAPAAPGGDIIGYGSASFPLTNGSYQGTVTVHFNTAAGKQLQNAKGYQCVLNFERDGRIVGSPAHKQGTSYSVDVRGAINP